MWDPLKIALKWSVGIAMGMKLLALCMLRILESLGGRGEGEGDDGDRDVKPSSSSHGRRTSTCLDSPTKPHTRRRCYI